MTSIPYNFILFTLLISPSSKLSCIKQLTPVHHARKIIWPEIIFAQISSRHPQITHVLHILPNTGIGYVLYVLVFNKTIERLQATYYKNSSLGIYKSSPRCKLIVKYYLIVLSVINNAYNVQYLRTSYSKKYYFVH